LIKHFNKRKLPAACEYLITGVGDFSGPPPSQKVVHGEILK